MAARSRYRWDGQQLIFAGEEELPPSRQEWIDGVNRPLLRKLRAAVDRNSPEKIKAVAWAAAVELRCQDRNLRFQETLEECCLARDANIDQVIGYLATLGMALLIACHRRSEEE